MKIGITFKKVLAVIISITLCLQFIQVDILFAKELIEKNSEEDIEADILCGLEYSNQSTDEVLNLINKGINTDEFFAPDLVKGITKEDLLEWKEEGKDIRDIVSQRANSESAVIDYGYFSQNNMESGNSKFMSKAVPTNGKYYLTECSNPEDKGNVNLSGTGYDDELFNPKTYSKGETTPWYIALAGDTAMCVTFEGNASISTAHNYIKSDINKLKSNRYFAGGNDYPIEGYLKGVCFAYEKLIDAGIGNTFFIKESIDSNLAELIRRAGSSELVARSGKSINYAVMQIITWRIACGKFNPDNMGYESELAKVIFGQMYPVDEWGDTYYKSIEAFYEYYAKCAKESATGKYSKTYGNTQLIYWEVQGSDTDKWQDFITWNVDKPSAKQISVTKYGHNTGVLEENAVYGIYSDKLCLNKLKEFTTDTNGGFQISAIEGTYYIKELKAPVGTVLNNTVLELTVNDDTTDINVTNDEICNKLEIFKYEYETGELVCDEAIYALYEYNSKSDSYLRVGQMNYDGNAKYSLNKSQTYTYHNSDGTEKRINTNKIYYTPGNLGKFMIREEKPPKGFGKSEDKYFQMTMINDEVISFNTYNNGVIEIPNYAAVTLKKNDYFTGTELSGATFMLQEKIDDNWYNVGSLVEEKLKVSDLNKSVEIIYRTSKNNKYVFHDKKGKVNNTITGSDYPVHYTVCNKGRYRIIETEVPDERYVGGWSRVFTVKPEENNYNYQFTDFGYNSAVNYGKSVKVKTLKYDSTTGEIVESQDTSAIITLYEYIHGINEWKYVGELQYSKFSHEYIMNENMQYKIHNEYGVQIRNSINGIYLPGYIYYTSANKGRFKIVETSSPPNYENGKYDGSNDNLVIYEKEFKISNTNNDRDVIDLTAFENAAVDTGISSNIELSKYDYLTKEKIDDGSAVFKVYEYIKKNKQWLEVGGLKYDKKNQIYSTVGMEVQYHNSEGNETDNEEICTRGLKYTNANEGKYKIVEVLPPKNYKNTGYEKEITITDLNSEKGVIRLEDYNNAAFDLGIGGYIEVAKYDSVTKEKVISNNAVFAVYEKNNNDWLKVGELVYDEERGYYGTKGGKYEFHDKSGKILDTENISGFETGKLYYTSVNKGIYKVVEETAPDNYILEEFEQEFVISYDNQNISYTAVSNGASDTGVSIPVELVKYDSITGIPVEHKDGRFDIQEYICISDKWVTVGSLVYNEEKNVYTTVGMKESVYHDSNLEECKKTKSDNVIYTTANRGRFRIVEVTEPSEYTIGTVPYVSEFNICDEYVEDVIDLTSKELGPSNIGKSGTIKVAKYDGITKEKVITGDAEFTIYEYNSGLDTWLEAGILAYNSEIEEYVCDNIAFLFHDNDGNIMQTEAINDYEAGRLYYTTSNKGRFKIVETKAPKNYILDMYEKEFEITESDEKFDFTDMKKASFDKGINGEVKLLKTDSITDAPLAGAIFVLKEWSKDKKRWISKGELRDNRDGTYMTDELVYTTQNEGRFIISELKSPEGYLNDGYESAELLLSDERKKFDLTDEGKATNTPIQVAISKKSVTTGKDIAGAELTVKNKDGDIIDKWISDGSDHIISGIKEGKYILEEVLAPKGYIKSSKIEFEVISSYDIQKVEMYDEIVSGKLIIDKSDKETGIKLSGAVFELRTKEGKLIQKLITDENGIAESENIKFGIYDDNGKYLDSEEYILTEVQAPSGYKCENNSVIIKFDYKNDATKIVEVRNELFNEKEAGVPTGDSIGLKEIVIFIAAGIVFIIVICRKRLY